MASLKTILVTPDQIDWAKLSCSELAQWYSAVSHQVAQYMGEGWADNSTEFEEWAEEQRALENDEEAEDSLGVRLEC